MALDSGFALAWAKLSMAHALYYFDITPTPAGAEAARQAAERAVALAPERPESQRALGSYYASVRNENDKALAAFEQGLKLTPDNAELLTAAALSEQSVGRWDEAVKHLERSRALDPRYIATERRLSQSLLRLRRYPEALASADRGLALAPDNLDLIENKAMVYLAQGDLPGARAVIRAAAPETEPTALVAAFGNYWDLFWVLDDDQQQLLLRLPPSVYDGDRGAWGGVRAQTYHVRGDRAQARVYADSARLGIEETLKATPDDPQRRAFLGLALAYLGRKAEAIEGRRASRGARAGIPRRLHRSLPAALARPHLHAGRRAGEGVGPARAAAPDAVLPLARLAQDRSRVRPAAEASPVPEARARAPRERRRSAPSLEAALAGRYAIERELGRGGMATVYLARDLRHDRPVALKVLHPELAATLGPERFLREIKLAARLQHPHILTVYDSGDAGGRLWFTMPFVEGESLRDRLRREQQLPSTTRCGSPARRRWRWTSPTGTARCTATSSRRTSCWWTGRRWWRTSGSPGRSAPATSG